jgi:IS30 family transposase
MEQAADNTESLYGLRREFPPKKTILSLANETALMRNMLPIHSRPRKCLAWKSVVEVFLHEVSHLTYQFA